ncbi:MAG: manganese efflux pump MntP family protein [Candidatus Bathyarchaeia archaeon]
MDIASVIFIAVGLAMDAFAVSIANGISTKSKRQRTALLTATSFSTFQMIMPVIGWVAGIKTAEVIIGIDHWVAFSLLLFIGAKMLYDSFKKGTKNVEDLHIYTLLTLSVATSIDALMVGLSFAFLQTAITMPILIIGLVTFVLSLTGFLFGSQFGKILKNKIKGVGGVILIAIGLKILVEHLS